MEYILIMKPLTNTYTKKEKIRFLVKMVDSVLIMTNVPYP